MDGGVDVKATGDIVINGRVGQARVASLEGIIRVQQGVYGTEGGTLLAAAKQVQSPVIEWAEVAAGTSVIAETISGSTIRCNGTVYAMTGRGMIANSTIRAGERPGSTASSTSGDRIWKSRMPIWASSSRRRGELDAKMMLMGNHSTSR